MSSNVEEIEDGEQFSSSVIDSFKKGTQTGVRAENIFEFFGFSSNPFDVTNLISHPNLITEKTRNLVRNLAERIGACYKNQGHLLVVGCESNARTTILKLLNATFNKGMDKNFCSYVDAPKKWADLSANEDDEGERIDNYDRWMGEVNFSNTRIIMIDDADAFVINAMQYADAIKFEHIETPTMVYCVTPTTQSIISQNDALKDFFADVFWITPLDDHGLKEILLRPINKISDSNPFDEASINYIIEHSLGLPGAATGLASLCLRNAYQIGVKKIDRSFVERVVSNEGYDIALELLRRKIRLEGTKYKVVREILTQYYLSGSAVERAMIISKFSDMATSTLSYHLKDLIHDGIIKQQRIGFKVYYSLPKSIRSALQLLILSPSNKGDDSN